MKKDSEYKDTDAIFNVNKSYEAKALPMLCKGGTTGSKIRRLNLLNPLMSSKRFYHNSSICNSNTNTTFNNYLNYDFNKFIIILFLSVKPDLNKSELKLLLKMFYNIYPFQFEELKKHSTHPFPKPYAMAGNGLGIKKN